MDSYHERSRAPLADALLDLVSLQQQIAALNREILEVEIRTLELQTRVNRTLGKMSDVAQQMELRAARSKKAATGVLPDAA